MLEVEPAGQWPKMTETATKPLPEPLQKHSLGGYTFDTPRSNGS